MRFSTQFTSMALSCLLMGAVPLSAATFSVGGIRYTSITEPSGGDHGTCKVAWQTQGISGDVVIPDDVTYSGKIYDVVEIADYAFNHYDYEYDIDISSLVIGNNVKKIGSSACTDQYLTTVTFGANVEEIGSSAFKGCLLQEVTIPAKVKVIKTNTFNDNMSIKKLVLNEGLESIESYAFYGCNNLPTVDIPSTVTSIEFDRNAFGKCNHMTAMNVAPDNTTYQSVDGIVYDKAGTSIIFAPMELSAETLSFPAALTTIGDAAFKDNKKIKTLNLPAALTTIGNDAFNGCTSLESLIAPPALRNIGEYAFASCTSLSSVSLGEGLETIGASAFKGCSALEEFGLPASVTSVHWSALYNCSGLQRISVAPGSAHYTSDGSALIETETATLLHYATSAPAETYRTPDNVRVLNSFAMTNVAALKKIDLNKVSTIGNDAIAILPELTEIYFGPSISSLGNGAVEVCGKLTTIKMDAVTPPSFAGQRDPFDSGIMAEAILYVPDAAVSIYRQDSYWSEFTTIKPMSEAPVDVKPAKVAMSTQASAGMELKIYVVSDGSVTVTGADKSDKADTYISSGPGTVITVTGAIYQLRVDGCQLSDLKIEDASDLAVLRCGDNNLTSLDLSACTGLSLLYCPCNDLQSLDVSGCTVLEELTCYGNRLRGADMTALMSTLPMRTSAAPGQIIVYNESYDGEQNECSKSDVDAARDRCWNVFALDAEDNPVPYEGKVDGIADVATDAAPVEYYNLQGVRVRNPSNGVYLRRQGSVTRKVMVK